MVRKLALLAVLLCTSSALASSGGSGESAKVEVGTPSLDMPPFMAPVTVDGELLYYMYIVLKLDLTSDFKKPEVLEKVPYLQDAILRDVHSAPLGSAADPAIVDQDALSARLKPVIEKILGPNVVAKVGFRNIARAAH